MNFHFVVELKGKVACEMSSHELMITEIVMDGLLTNLKAAEIAALLSCLVFQHNTDCEQSLTKTLEQVLILFPFLVHTIQLSNNNVVLSVPFLRVLKKCNESIVVL